MDNYSKSDKQVSMRSNRSDAGYTILEAIIAVLIVTVLMSIIAPVIGFSVGTRVSAKRIELASQASRSYIDWVRIDPANRGPAPTDATSTLDVAAPTLSSALGTACTASTYCDTGKTLFCVDGDGNGTCEKTSLKDMLVQAVSRNASGGFKLTATTANYQQGYALWIRVYRADAFNQKRNLSKTKSISDINATGSDPTFPLMTVTTEIPPTINSLQNLKNRLQ